MDKEVLFEPRSDQSEDELEGIAVLIMFLRGVRTLTIFIAFLASLFALHPKIRDRFSEACKDRVFHKIPKRAYTTKKEKLLMIERALAEKPDRTDDEQREIVENGLEERADSSQGVISHISSTVVSWVTAGPPSTFGAPHVNQHFAQDHRRKAKVDATKIDDADFLARLPSIVEAYPVLAEAAADVTKLAREHLAESINKHTHVVANFAEETQLKDCKQQIQNQVNIERRKQEHESRCKFFADVRDAYRDGTKECVLYPILAVSHLRWSVIQGRDHTGRAFGERRIHLPISSK